jgi:transcriptional regulator with XRE-family HTH domain
VTDQLRTPIRQLRQAAGLSIRELEARTGINRGRLSIIERGVAPTDDEARAILAAFQATPAGQDLSNVIGSQEGTA